MHGEPWGGVLAAGAHVRTVRMCKILASHVAHLAGQILHEGGRVEQSKLGRRHLTDAPATKWLGADAGTSDPLPDSFSTQRKTRMSSLSPSRMPACAAPVRDDSL